MSKTLKEDEGQSYADFCGKSLPGRWNSRDKIPGAGICLACLRNSQEAGEEMKEKVKGEVREEGPCQPLQGVGFYSRWAEGLLEGLG